MPSTIPIHTDACWKDPHWRTQTLISIMSDNGLKAAEVGDFTGNTEQTVFGWRASAARPIPALALRVLMFELARSNRGAA